MIRCVAGICALAAMLFFLAGNDAARGQAQQKNQMVSGTIKSVDVEKNVLVINQKVKNEKVERELSITEDVEFEVDGKILSARKGMESLEKRVGANVKVKCDKDVNVLKVTVK